MAIDWLREEEFDRRFETEYRPQKRYLVNSLVSETSFVELSKILPQSLSSKVDENEGLGMCERWFGTAAENFLFTISCYGNLPLRLDFSIKDEVAEKYQWSFIDKLLDFPPPILNRIVWIRSEFSVNKLSVETKKSILYKDEHGIIWEVYRAVDKMEAIELLNFLQKLKSDYEYWIDEPEDENQTWIIIKHTPDGEQQLVARYSQRCWAEDSARRMSLRDNAYYQVKEEKSSKSGLAFHKGKIDKEGIFHTPDWKE